MTETSKHQILVVDDEPSIREVMSSLLNEAGYEVRTAQHGFHALSQLRTVIPDVIISDLHMPQMSGFEFLSVFGVDFRKSLSSPSLQRTDGEAY